MDDSAEMDESDSEATSSVFAGSSNSSICRFDDDPDDSSEQDLMLKRRNRTSFTPEQLKMLEDTFQESRYPDAITREAIAESTKLTEQKIQVRVVCFSAT